MTIENRPPIPEMIKREVRQKCKFACVVCRSPIYDYEHLVDYAICREHTTENIFLICPNCHRKKRNKMISREQILKSFDNIKNEDKTKPDFIFNESFSLFLGSVNIKSFQGYLFNILDRDYFKVTKNAENKVIIDAKLYDNKGNIAISIEKSEYTLFTDKWDITHEGGVITFRESLGKIFLVVTFNQENKSISVEGKFLLEENNLLTINQKGIFYNDSLLLGNVSIGYTKQVGLYIAQNHKKYSKNSLIYDCNLFGIVITENRSFGNDASIINSSICENVSITYNQLLGDNSSIIIDSIVKNCSIKNNSSDFGIVFTNDFLSNF